MAIHTKVELTVACKRARDPHGERTEFAPLSRRNRLFEVLPAAGPLDPAVAVMIDSLAVSVQSTDEDELVVTADISA